MDYAYAWNSPDFDVATANGLTPEPAQPAADDTAVTGGITYLNPEGERKALSPDDITELCPPTGQGAIERERLAHERRVMHLRRRLQALPAFIRYRFSRQLEELNDQDPARAVKWLFGTFERHILRRIEAVNAQYLPQDSLPAILLPLREDFHLLPWANKKRLKRLAYKLANLMKSEFMREFDFQFAHSDDPEFSTIYSYGAVASKARHLNIPVPGWEAYCNESLEAEDALRAVARLQSEKWWSGKLKRAHDRWREHLMIATGYVSKHASPKCSEPCLKEWAAQKKANFEYLSSMELEDQDTGERSSLLDKVMSSTANPKIARLELTTRAAGFQEIADEMGLVGMFYTLTAPSKCHAMHIASGKRNDKYRNADPRATQKYLCKVWARTRAAWKRRGIRTFGFRTAEPHHDSTPHWHLVLWFRPEDVEEATEVFRMHALKEDGNEPGADKYRFKAEREDKSRGRAIGYIVKYISKNIDGYGMDGEVDKETGNPIKEEARRVRAWASRWGIRQFQQIGGAPVTTWRELRRLGSRELVLHPEIEPLRAAADGASWQDYVQLQGGAFVERDQLKLRLHYSTTENSNDYGDTVSKIEGIYCPLAGSDAIIYTRTAQYKIVPKRKTPETKGVDLDFSGGNAAPWSSVNNCTRDPAAGADGVEHAASEATGQSEMTVPAEGVTVNFDALSRQEKRELAQRLSADVRSKRKKRPPEREESTGLSVKEQQISELLALRGIDASAGMVRSLMAGASVACGDLVMTVQDGRLVSCNRVVSGLNKLPSQVMAAKKKTSDLVNRMKTAFSGRK
ncbi:replication endonuclease [Enterobacter hormaechei]|nr:replication endonuclease [Enterobacter hormaechei]